MALTDSNMMPLGTRAPDFALPDAVSGKTLTFADVAGERGTLVMFICNHCPYVIHIARELAAVAAEYDPRSIGFVAISSNDVNERPEDGPAYMREFADQYNFIFPYLYDETQEVARAYDAVCTPDFFLFDADGKCAYRGQFDASRPKSAEPVTGADMRASLDAVLEGDPIPEEAQVPSQGCSIKWKTA
ncbi:thioredoxin family protein [Salinisphaera sp. LB1]|uniref:thioredoxin family protein n=1 Tax=Salinisphaera sp. LB1 TaxID=2183911 RepID=UPI000D7061D7|nr:thioredoxin family protein [Salinisphaera sp. LB1]AWN14591.1 PPO candidate 1 [Salinisphaera sp. LB1]